MISNYQFLNQIQQLIEMYEKQRELLGENFNIFSIMNMEYDEVRTHSALITELLNPKGSHSLGLEPLKLFYKIVLDKQCELNLDTINCVKEEHAGFISEDKTEGGRLDIVIKDINENGLVIENKIYAGEQINQLSRYSNKYPKAKILYLTLEGNESKQDTSKEIEYQQISYKEHITEWITACSKLAYDKPVIRETLKQYLFLIKKLTNQTTNTEMSEKIIDIINKNFEASAEIYKNFEKALVKRQDEFLNCLMEKLKIEMAEWQIEKIENYESSGSGLLNLTKNEFELRYRIKNFKHSVFSINVLTEELEKEGFSENRKNKLGDNKFRYWLYKANDIGDSIVSNPEETEKRIIKKLKDIISCL